ncbi:MAG: threonine ammonia-lyase [Eubacteriales bacterium]|nr:threonine ammonia-lyase [Eubacteriales bacterium]MDD4390054.1 threonine ammonia-lyase [Eubacteriales bacterium]
MVSLDMIKDAQNVIKKDVRMTDLFLASNISEDNEIYLKTENLQVTGSFKARGAAYKISNLSDEEKARGIIACSAGNHAQGVARASQKNNIKCNICMPINAPVSKVAATQAYGADICLVKDTYDDAYLKAKELQKETGATFVHPFNDKYVIAGQGTIGLEILDQLPDVDAIITAIGGGGLLSGIALAVKALKPECKVYGVQAANASAMYNSFKEKKLTSTSSSDTFADGIAVKAPGDLTYDIISKYVDDIAVVSEDEIAAAVLMLLEKQKVISEGAGAASVAAAYFNKFDLKGKKVACVVSGGNIDVNILNRVIARGLIMSGRKTSFTVALPDRPGTLNKACGIIGDLGGNILEVYHSNSDPNMPISSCFVRFLIETRSAEHAQNIKDAFADAGFEIKNHVI